MLTKRVHAFDIHNQMSNLHDHQQKARQSIGANEYCWHIFIQQPQAKHNLHIKQISSQAASSDKPEKKIFQNTESVDLS